MGEVETCNSCNELEWLDANYVTKILSSTEGKKNIELGSFHKEPATVKGENYASAMHLLTASYSADGESKKISMIVKSRLNNDLMAEIEEEFNVFERESQVYRHIMKSCELLLSRIGDRTMFGPRCVYVDNRVIVQENLKEKGYKILEIKKGLNYEQCSKVLEKIAKFHACTMVLNEKNSELFRYHQKGNVSEKTSPLHELYKNSFATCIEYIQTVPELKQYKEKLEKYGKDVIKKMVSVFSKSSDSINTLNHGDAWVNNFMFKIDENGNILDVLLVDYQEGYFGSPGIDWNYFMYSSWQESVFVHHKDELISLYHNILANALRELNYKKQIPSLRDIYNEIKRKADHGLVTTVCLLPILISEHPDLANPENFLSNSEEAKRKRFIVFNNNKYAKLLEIYLKHFVQEKILI